MQIEEYHRMAKVAEKHWWYVSKRQLLTNLINQWLPKSKSAWKILDIGAGTGSNWPTLRKFGQVEGVEQSKVGIKYAQVLGWKNIFLGDANQLNFPAEKYNLITILDVLYHQKIKSDQKVLTKIHGLVKPGGWLIVTDCAGPNWYGKHDVLNLARQRYTLPEMVNKVKLAGFEVRHSSYFYFFTYPIFVLVRWLQKLNLIGVDGAENLPPSCLNAVFIRLLKFEAKIASRWSLPKGSSVVILAQKPAE